MYHQFGAIVPQASSSSLVFRYFGKHHRSVHTATRLVKGDATAGATTIQWRMRGIKWHNVIVSPNGSWVTKVRHLLVGKNKIRLRALDAGGDVSAVQRLVIVRR